MTREADEEHNVDDVNKRLGNIHINNDSDENATGDSIQINVVDENEERVESSPSESPPRPSSAELLARVLQARRNLDLTGKIFVEPHAIRTKHGGAADVYEGHDKETNVKVAVKRLRLNIGRDEKIAKDIAREIRVWSELEHKNILPILGYCIEGDYPSLVSIWVENGSLRDCMASLNESETLAMVLGIASGLAYIHSKKAIHSDLKSDNVLVSPSKEALLTDFGISRMDALTAGYTTHSVKGSTRWQALEFFDIPEDNSPAPTHTTKTDIWAFGMTVYELLTHQLPYYNIKDTSQVILCISRGRRPSRPQPQIAGKSTSEADEFLWSVCERCWKDADSRPSMEDLEKEISNFSGTFKSTST